MLLSFSHKQAQGRKLLMKREHLRGDQDQRCWGGNCLLQKGSVTFALENKSLGPSGPCGPYRELRIRLNLLLVRWLG